MQLPPKAPATGKKVAVVGAGPAGLTVAADLVKLGHEITMFEALHVGGGVFSYGIPEFRLPKAIVQNEVTYIQKLGVDLRLGNLVGRIHTIPELMKEAVTMQYSSVAVQACHSSQVAKEKTLAESTQPTNS